MRLHDLMHRSSLVCYTNLALIRGPAARGVLSKLGVVENTGTLRYLNIVTFVCRNKLFGQDLTRPSSLLFSLRSGPAGDSSENQSDVDEKGDDEDGNADQGRW